MLALMQHNVTLNNLEEEVTTSVYNWDQDKSPESVRPDVVVAADCVYFEPACPLLQQSLRDVIGPEPTCYFCFKKRRRVDLRFMKAVNKEFSVEAVTDDPDREVYGRENIFLYVDSGWRNVKYTDLRVGILLERSRGLEIIRRFDEHPCTSLSALPW